MKHLPLEALIEKREAIAQAIEKGHYKRTRGGVVFPTVSAGKRNCMGFQGALESWVNDRDHDINHNIVVNVGLNLMLGCGILGSAQTSSWYVAPYANSHSPVATSVLDATFIATTVGEITAYDEATRQAFTGVAGSQLVTNDASRASFTINSSVTARGAFIGSSSAKSATGTLLAYANFSAARTLVDDDVLTVKYTISATSS